MSRKLASMIQAVYKKEDQTDYWQPPMVIADKKGRIKNGDTLIFTCRRGEREIQLTEAFVEKDFPHFKRLFLDQLLFVPMTLYHEKFSQLTPLFSPVIVEQTLSEVLSNHGKKQLSITESEKEAHVTYFFNGRRSKSFPGQNTIILPSIKNYENRPEMKSLELAQEVITALSHRDFIVVNFPAGDVIGHLNDFAVKVKAIETIDQALGPVIKAALAEGFRLIITADHGLIEKGRDEEGKPSVGHTTAQVPLILVNSEKLKLNTKEGYTHSLADIAPTVLNLMGVPIPAAMTGVPLVAKPNSASKVLLIILDGWGIGSEDPYFNPIKAAKTPIFDKLLKKYPTTKLEASQGFVGLQKGSSGNSEAGHLTLGAGRIVPQDGLRVQEAIETGFANNEILQKVIAKTASKGAALHLLGLLSEGSSHGSIHELLAIKQLAFARGISEIYTHLILDGRSAPPRGALELLQKYGLDQKEANLVTLVGRGYALDRDKNYLERTKPAYDALVMGKGRLFHL